MSTACWWWTIMCCMKRMSAAVWRVWLSARECSAVISRLGWPGAPGCTMGGPDTAPAASRVSKRLTVIMGFSPVLQTVAETLAAQPGRASLNCVNGSRAARA